MARLSATALLILLVSLFAVAHGGHATDDESAEKTGPPNPVPLLPVGSVLRLPSHRNYFRQHPCGRDRHLWWARHHGVFRYDPERGESRPVHVAEPDPDRSLPDSDEHGRQDGEEAAVKPWKEEMLRRMFHFHHALRHHHHRRGEEEQDREVQEHEQDEEEEVARGMKRRGDEEVDEEENKLRKRFDFHHRHHDHEQEAEDEEEKEMRKEPHHADDDSDDEHEQDDEVEEMVRRFRKAILKSRYGHGRRFHHHHRHRHAEAEAEKADGEVEEGGVMTWIKGIVNRF